MCFSVLQKMAHVASVPDMIFVNEDDSRDQVTTEASNKTVAFYEVRHNSLRLYPDADASVP